MTDMAITGTQDGVPAPTQTLPPTVDQETQNPPATAQVESTPLGNATGVSNPPDEQINTSQDQPQPQLQSQPVGSTVLPPRTPLPAPAGSMPAPKGVSPDSPYANHPSVQRGGLVHAIGEALGGGPRYAIKINPMTGETERTELPMSNKTILGAIALEALGGAAAGLGAAPGPGNLGRAAAAGYQQISQQEQAQKDRQMKEASDDYARQARIFETNLQMHNNAQTVGRQTLENNQAYVGQYQELANKILNDYPNVAQDIVPESDLAKYHATKDNAIPYKVVPRLGQDGEQSKDEYGTPQWDIDYIVVDPKFKADDLLTEQDRQDAAKYHLQGFVGSDGKPTKLPSNLMLSLGMVTNYKSQIAALKLADQDLDEFGRTVNAASPSSNNLVAPTMPDSNIQDTVDKYAKQYGVRPEVARALVMQESGGRQLGPDGKPIQGPSNHTGERAVGATQLLPSTAKAMGVDPNDQDQNIEGGMKYLGQLVKQYGGDYRLALAAYNAGPDNVKDHVPDNGQTKQYVDNIVKATGLGPVDQGGQKPSGTFQPVDLSKAIADKPALKQYLKEFQPYRVNSKSSLQSAIGAYSAKNADGGAAITQMYGGNDNIRQYDQNKTLQLDEQKAQISEGKTQANAKAKQQLDQEAATTQQTYLKGPDNWRFDPRIKDFDDPEDAADYLKSKGVMVPDQFESLWAVAHNQQALTSAAARVWVKGDPYGTSQQWNSTYIHKFLNPGYRESDYDNVKRVTNNMKDESHVGGGKVLVDAGTAAQHLQQLLEASKELGNPNLSDDQSLQALNKVYQNISGQTGKSAPEVFNGIRDLMGIEVAKVAQGGQPMDAEIKQIQSRIGDYSSPAQIKGLATAYTHLMASRIQTMESNYYKTTGEHLPVDDNTTQVFQNYGIGTPWIDIPKGYNKPLDPTNPNDAAVMKQYLLAAGKLTNGKYDTQKALQMAQKDKWVVNTGTSQGNNQSAQAGAQ